MKAAYLRSVLRLIHDRSVFHGGWNRDLFLIFAIQSILQDLSQTPPQGLAASSLGNDARFRNEPSQCCDWSNVLAKSLVEVFEKVIWRVVNAKKGERDVAFHVIREGYNRYFGDCICDQHLPTVDHNGANTIYLEDASQLLVRWRRY